MISIIAQNKVLPDKIEAFKALARELVAETRKEKGCIAYALNQDLKDPAVLTFIERWEDQAAIDAHFIAPHFQRLVPLLGPLQAAPGDIRLYHEVD